MATIKPIESRTVHQIQSGQVIVDLCSVVKELVENSVDAGATSIDVRFKNQGLDVIEVQDNGAGISAANYESVCLKHHTSKLSTYDDLASLQTFGFRGEALASLCALSTLTITTCLASDVPKGTGLSFEASGRLQGTSVVAAQKGTTVSVEKLFHNLPVRRRELERNIKREWQKVIALLNQYACILTGLKFSVSQQPSKGKRIILFSTKGNSTVRENIINIFSAKMTNQLVPLDLQLEMKPTRSGHGLRVSNNDETQLDASKEVRVVGHVSRPVHGEGRQTPDRQMFFVNGRPCGLPQFAKTFNEVYRSYNSTQSPFICADIRLDTDMYDVNVSPDKRSIMLHDQNQMLDTLRASLISLFDDHEYSMPVASMSRNTVAKPDPRPSQPSTFRFRKQDPEPASPSSAESEVDNSDGNLNEEDENPSPEQQRTNIDLSNFTNGSARRIPSANSISMGGPHSQSLLRHWVASKTGEPSRGPRPPAELAGGSSSDSNRSRGRYIAAVASPQSSGVDGNAETETEKPTGDNIGSPEQRLSETCGAEDDLVHQSVTSRASEATPSQGDSRVASDSEDGQRHSRYSKRAAPQLATITIGDETTTSWIGSSAKRSRSATPEKPQLSFGSRLSQMFAAGGPSSSTRGIGGTRQTLSTSDSSENEDEGNSDDSDEAPREATPAPPHSLDNSGASSSGHEDSLFVPDEMGPDDEPATLPKMHVSEEAQPRAAAFEAARRRKDTTTVLKQVLEMSEDNVTNAVAKWKARTVKHQGDACTLDNVEDITHPDAEAKLSLVISRGDFSRMRVAGQFNLGFIIATRPRNSMLFGSETSEGDELFIIDQHASDEKYNFERLQSETTVQSQRLVQPKQLELTALEEEIVMHNLPAIEANGFKVHFDISGDSPVGARCQLLALPLSRETTFDLADLEELISLLGDSSNESSHVPRPAKVRKMFAMRACRSSVMIGKALTQSQMYGLVKHMGEMDKPWNCPHGRPTMRHLCRLQSWDTKGWKNDIGVASGSSWAEFMGT